MAIPFGKYALQRKLAEGGMAEVFLAKQAGMEGFEKLVVLKRIRPELSSDTSFINMFLNEARVAARLNHPNVVQIYELGKVEQTYFIAMEFIHGEDLRSLVRQGEADKKHPPPGLICRIIADTLAGLHYAHTRSSPDGKPLGLVHRDVSPQNVLVTYEGGVKLVDFGIAKTTMRSGFVEQTRAGLFKGKFAYMSPEQSRGQPLDARSDIFAVGILFWELLTWTRLFKRANDMATLIAVADGDIPSPRSFDAKIPPELEAIVMRALQRKVHMRYTTALDMRAELEALIRQMGWEADSLALQNYMADLFAAKLRSQEEDIRSSGFGSLEDFLLTVDEKSQISWIGAAKLTPSSGMPPSPVKLPGMVERPTQPGGGEAKLGRAATELDMLATGIVGPGAGELEELPGSATTVSAMPTFEHEEPKPKPAPQSGLKPKVINANELGMADTAPVAEVPAHLPAKAPLFTRIEPADTAPVVVAHPPAKPQPPPKKDPRASKPMHIHDPAPEMPNESTAIGQVKDLPSLPTAIVVPGMEPKTQPRTPAKPQPTPSQELVLPSTIAAPFPSLLSPHPQPHAFTAVASADTPTLHPGSPAAKSAEADAAAVMTAVKTNAARPTQALSPFDPKPPITLPRMPSVDGNGRKRGLLLLVAGVVAITVAGLTTALWPAKQPTSARAIIEISLDAPGLISVDGTEQAIGQRASVEVRAGINHTITVTRDGRIIRKLTVPGLKEGEVMPLNVK